MSNTWVVSVAMALITTIVACGPTEGPPSISTSPPRPTNAPQATAVQTPSEEAPQSTPPLSEGGREARVTRIIDGDTIEVDIGGIVFQVRYIGIDCPEADHPFGPEATEANRHLVEGKTVRLDEDISEADEFDRLLRYVYVGDLLVNAEMIRLGYARAVSYPPNVLYDDLFARLEIQAKEAGAGLWAAPSQLVGYLAVDPSCCQFDSPGDDSKNKEEEYVCFSNDGPEAFDLSGCTLSDEYGWTYHFQPYLWIRALSSECALVAARTQPPICTGATRGPRRSGTTMATRRTSSARRAICCWSTPTSLAPRPNRVPQLGKHRPLSNEGRDEPLPPNRSDGRRLQLSRTLVLMRQAMQSTTTSPFSWLSSFRFTCSASRCTIAALREHYVHISASA